MKSDDRWPLLSKIDMVDALANGGLGIAVSAQGVNRDDMLRVLDAEQDRRQTARQARLDEPIIIGFVTLEVGKLYDVHFASRYYRRANDEGRWKRGMRFDGTDLVRSWSDDSESITTIFTRFGAKPNGFSRASRERELPERIIEVRPIEPNKQQRDAIKAHEERTARMRELDARARSQAGAPEDEDVTDYLS